MKTVLCVLVILCALAAVNAGYHGGYGHGGYSHAITHHYDNQRAHYSYGGRGGYGGYGGYGGHGGYGGYGGRGYGGHGGYGYGHGFYG